ncbi:MAG: phosphatase PAP2 family protein [Cyclobacteriaceae bacterium]|nr:phosphatase PAP2 family protein [Cyclobacteriaceae bacterium]
MKSSFWLILVLLVSLVTALGVYRVSENKTTEQKLIRELQLMQTPASVRFLQLVSDSISYFSLGIPALAIAAGLIRRKKAWVRHALIILLGIALGGSVSAVIKRTVKEPRPYEVDKQIAQLSVGGSNSFPSGHTVEATAAAVGFSTLLFRTPVSAILSAAWALSIMFSRIVLGVHNVTDILAGAAIGCMGLLIVYRLFELRPLRET